MCLAFGAGVFALAAQADTVDFLLLDPEPVTGESLGNVTSIARSPSDESLWIGMDGQGILRIGRNGRRIRYTAASGHLSSDSVSQLLFLSDGTLYILDGLGTLVRYTSVEGFRPVSGLSGAVTSLVSDNASRILISLDNGTVLSISESSEPSLFCRPAFPVVFMTTSSDALYLCGSAPREICAYSLQDGTLLRTLPGLPVPARCLASAGELLFAGTDRGVYQFSESGWVSLDLFEETASRRVQSLFLDDANRLWVASWAGVHCCDVSKTNVSKSELLLPDQTFLLRSVYAGGDRVLYLGGVRGVAAVSLSSSFEMAPWTTQPEPTTTPHSDFGFWVVFGLLVALLLGFLLGRLLRPRPITVPSSPEISPQVGPEVPVDQTASLGQLSAETEPTPARARPKSSKPIAPVPPTISPSALVARVRELEANPADGFVSEVLPLIRQSLSDPRFSVEDIASALHLSRVHVNRKLQAELGISPSMLIKASRMSLASELLLQNEIPVAEIASRTGFSSASYFSSAFREFFGVSPREYLTRPDLRG